jgi:flagellar P-ring protein precursor FlgI
MRTTPLRPLLAAVFAVLVLLFAAPARADHVKDLCDVVGVRENQLVGYGVVTGLTGTGDDASAPFATQSLLSLMRKLGVQAEGTSIRLKNVAAVLVTANIAPFARPGTRLDVTVSSIGNARSLQGGVLVQTPLYGADGRVYAVSQGSLIVGGMEAHGASASMQKNSPNAARIPDGALVERLVQTTFSEKGKIVYSLRQPDFLLAQRISEAIDKEMGSKVSVAVDGGAVSVTLASEDVAVATIARLGEIDVSAPSVARVVINERTGTIVAGGDVQLAPVAIATGGLTVLIRETPDVSQPIAPAGGGTTKVMPRTEVGADENGPGKNGNTMAYVKGAARLADVASALSSLGISPRELVNVLSALKSAGALRATLVVQ